MGETGAPKCSVCGSKHWSSEAHIWPDEKVKTPAVKVKVTKKGVDDMAQKVVDGLEACLGCEERDLRIAVLEKSLSGSGGDCAVCTARREKHANYMKRKRAAEKGKSDE